MFQKVPTSSLTPFQKLKKKKVYKLEFVLFSQLLWNTKLDFYSLCKKQKKKNILSYLYVCCFVVGVIFAVISHVHALNIKAVLAVTRSNEYSLVAYSTHKILIPVDVFLSLSYFSDIHHMIFIQNTSFRFSCTSNLMFRNDNF